MLFVWMKSLFHSKTISQRLYLYITNKSPFSLPLDALKKANFFILQLKTCFSWMILVFITLVSLF